MGQSPKSPAVGDVITVPASVLKTPAVGSVVTPEVSLTISSDNRSPAELDQARLRAAQYEARNVEEQEPLHNLSLLAAAGQVGRREGMPEAPDSPMEGLKAFANGVDMWPLIGAVTEAVVNTPWNLAAIAKWPTQNDPIAQYAKDNPKQAALFEGILQDRENTLNEIKAKYAEGDLVTAGRKAFWWMLPLVGAPFDHGTDELVKGNYWKALGTFGAAVVGAYPEAIAGRIPNPSVSLGPLKKNPNIAAREAVLAGQNAGVQGITAGVATGNPLFKSVGRVADSSLVGSVIALEDRARGAAGMRRYGQELADVSSPTPRTPLSAGEGVVEQLTNKTEAHASFATEYYNRVNAAVRKYRRQVQVGTTTRMVKNPRTGKMEQKLVPVYEQMDAPVDVRRVKRALRPLLEQEERQLPLTQAEASAGLKALRNIVNGPNDAPLMQLDKDLGAIKQLANPGEASGQGIAFRNRSQGLAGRSVAVLQRTVDDAARRYSPKMAQELQAARDATRMKYDTNDILKAAKAEPAKYFEALVDDHDGSIVRLRELAQQTPAAIPMIARAWLQKQIDHATGAGGFEHGGALYGAWERLGAETKQLLFPKQGEIQALDNYFLLAKLLHEDLAFVHTAAALHGLGQVTGLVLGSHPGWVATEIVSMGALSKALRSPSFVRALNENVEFIKAGKGTPAQNRTAMSRVLTAARNAGIVSAATAEGRAERDAERAPTPPRPPYTTPAPANR